MSLDKIKIFSGNANPLLSGEIISSLNVAQGKALVGRFSDGESQVEILENVRGCDVFVLQPTCGPSPAETLMELLVIVDALNALLPLVLLPLYRILVILDKTVALA
ncbi:Ribose-phosphate pyrophosphokinase (EC [uncultured Gammaproteobacteria bacterium]|nr:Ribose-phosphate pyrophosphokinase (EC [uncultured Gammaproteobacteria bacterium]